MRQESAGAEVTTAVGVALIAGVKKHREPDAPLPSKSSSTILVVDNDPVLRTLVARFLVLAGYRVLEARHGSEGLAVAERHHEPVNLLLTDIMMPEMNGFELAEAFRRLHPEGHVLYMSGHVADRSDVREAFETHRSEFLIKPFWAEALLEKIQSILPNPGSSAPVS